MNIKDPVFHVIIDAFIAAHNDKQHEAAVYTLGTDRRDELRRWAMAFWGDQCEPFRQLGVRLKGDGSVVYFRSLGDRRHGTDLARPMFVEPRALQMVAGVVDASQKGGCQIPSSAFAIFEGLVRG